MSNFNSVYFILFAFVIFNLSFVVYSRSYGTCSKKSVLLKTTSGTVNGICDYVTVNREESDDETRNTNIYSFLSIPYAEPPIGENRFEPPIPVNNSSNVIDGTKWPNSCIQHLSNQDSQQSNSYKMWFPTSGFSEDCLYLNVFMPLEAYNKVNIIGGNKAYRKLPIMVFFHGGNYVSGSSVLDVYNPASFVAATRVIAVTFNYRVGVYGFLHLDKNLKGNQGFLDQHLAIKWVYDNADVLGGDRDRITLVGQGTGAEMIGYHLLYKPSWPYFRKVILQSGSPFHPATAPLSAKDASNRGLIYSGFAKCKMPNSNTQTIVSCLKERSTSYLNNAASLFFSNLCFGNKKTAEFLTTPFPMVIDGETFSSDPKTLFNKNEYKKCPILTGFNENEASFLIGRSGLINTKNASINYLQFLEFLRGYFSYYPNYPYQAGKVLTKAIVYEYKKVISTKVGNKSFKGKNFLKTLENILNHYRYVCPALKLADIYSMSNQVYVYSYENRVPTSPWPQVFGVTHGDEIAMTFAHVISNRAKDSIIGVNPWFPESKNTYQNNELMLCNKIIDYWSNFIKFDDPNQHDYAGGYTKRDLIPWMEYNTTTQTILKIQKDELSTIKSELSKICFFWDSYVPSLVNDLDNNK